MKVLVTGATGFIGGHLTHELLAVGHEVRAVARPTADVRSLVALGAEIACADMTVPESLPALVAGVDAIIHLAGVTQASRPSTFFRVNSEGTRHLAIAASRLSAPPRFIYISTLAAAGPSPAGHPHIEPGDDQPTSDYGRSKLAAEAGLADAGACLTTVTLRPSIVYGPGDRELLSWLSLVRSRLVPVVDGLDLSFLHVSDLASACLSALDSPDLDRAPYFLSDGAPVRMSAVIELLSDALGASQPFHVPLGQRLLAALAPAVESLAERVGAGSLAARTVRDLSASGWTCLPTRFQAATGWTPTVRLRDGLSATVGWYQDNGWLNPPG